MSDIRIPTHRIIMAVAVGRRADAHAVIDSFLGSLPDGRPVVRLGTPLEKVDTPGVVAAWGAATGARAAVFGPVLTPMVEALVPDATAVDAISPVSHVRWPSPADVEPQTRAVGYVVTHAWVAEATGEDGTVTPGYWQEYATRAQVLEQFKLAPLSGSIEEQEAALAAAEAIEAAAVP